MTGEDSDKKTVFSDDKKRFIDLYIRMHDADLTDEQKELVYAQVAEIEDYNKNNYVISTPDITVARVLRKMFPREYEYTIEENLMSYAYPEHEPENDQIDITEYQDLYEAGYRDDFINQLVAQLRQRLLANTNPRSTNICISDYLAADNHNAAEHLLEEFVKAAKNYQEKSKWVILAPLGIDGHAHALMIHIHIISSDQSYITICLRDPYGKRNNFEEKFHGLFERLATKFSELMKHNIIFTKQNDPDDLQGFDYDNSNCAALTIFTLNYYLDCALQGEHPQQYKLRITFDSLPNSVLNESLHKAFVLRLKTFQLKSINYDTNLAFNKFCNRKVFYKDLSVGINEPIDDYVDAIVEEVVAEAIYEVTSDLQAKDQAEKLYNIMVTNANTKYEYFINEESRIFINNLTDLQKFELLNRISNQVISQYVPSPVSNPCFFSKCLNRIFKYFLELIDEAEVQNAYRAFSMFITQRQLPTTDESTRVRQDPNLVRAEISALDKLRQAAMSAKDYDLFKSLLFGCKAEPDFIAHATTILRVLLNKATKAPNYYVFIQDPTKRLVSVKHSMIDDLLAVGSDIYAREVLSRNTASYGNRREISIVSTPSIVELITRFPPSYSKLLLRHFPGAINRLVLEAARCCNIELLKVLLSKDLSIDNATLSLAIESVGDGLRKEKPIKRCPLGFAQIRDPEYMQELRLAPKLIEAAKILLKSQQTKQTKKTEQATSAALPILPQNPHIQLIEAVKANNIDAVRALLNSGQIKNIDMQDSESFNALRYAMLNRNFLIARVLLEAGAKLFTYLSDGFTPLHVILECNDCKILNNLLLGTLKSLLEMDILHELLQFTAMQGHDNAFRWLVDNYFDTFEQQQRDQLIRRLFLVPCIKDNEQLSLILRQYLSEQGTRRLQAATSQASSAITGHSDAASMQEVNFSSQRIASTDSARFLSALMRTNNLKISELSEIEACRVREILSGRAHLTEIEQNQLAQRFNFYAPLFFSSHTSAEANPLSTSGNTGQSSSTETSLDRCEESGSSGARSQQQARR